MGLSDRAPTVQRRMNGEVAVETWLDHQWPMRFARQRIKRCTVSLKALRQEFGFLCPSFRLVQVLLVGYGVAVYVARVRCLRPFGSTGSRLVYFWYSSNRNATRSASLL